MSIKGRDKEFRTPKTTYVDFKHIEMDRVLTMLFPRLKYDGYASRRPPRGGDLTIEEFMEDFLEHPEWFAGFDRYPQVVHRWIEPISWMWLTVVKPIRPLPRRDLCMATPISSETRSTPVTTARRNRFTGCSSMPGRAKARPLATA